MALSSIYTVFEDDDIVTDDKETVTTGLWKNGVGVLTTFYTSSVQSASTGNYYLDIYSDSSASNLEFSIAYGHVEGSGSTLANEWPTKAIYGQYRNLLLNAGDEKFLFTGQVSGSNDIFIININRANLKDKIDPGNWELHLSGTAGLYNNVHLIDDSSNPTSVAVTTTKEIYHIVSGTINNGIKTAASRGKTWGYVYPEFGLLVFDAQMLEVSTSLDISAAISSDQHNVYKFLQYISGSLPSTPYFAARSEEEVTSTHYFCRLKNKSYNFSNNPSWTSGSYGEFRHTNMRTDPKTYTTTVGLYDDYNNLLAIAKLSIPQLKSFSRELLLKIKLDF